jgi:hypothetical protein
MGVVYHGNYFTFFEIVVRLATLILVCKFICCFGSGVKASRKRSACRLDGFGMKIGNHSTADNSEFFVFWK